MLHHHHVAIIISLWSMPFYLTEWPDESVFIVSNFLRTKKTDEKEIWNLELLHITNSYCLGWKIKEVSNK